MGTLARLSFMTLLTLVWLAGAAVDRAFAQQAGVTLTFSNVTETVKTKTKIDKSAMTTNTTSKFTVKGDVVVDNASTSNAPVFWVLLWIEQPTNLVTYPDGVPIGEPHKLKALKAGKSIKVSLDFTFGTDQAGTYFFLTSTNIDVIASVKIPAVDE